MDKFVANLNIAHFRQQLAEETNSAKRLMLARLLAEEEAKLTGLSHGLSISSDLTGCPRS